MSKLFISINNKIDFVIDENNNLCVEKHNPFGTVQERITIGFLTPTLINQMIDNLNRLRPHAK